MSIEIDSFDRALLNILQTDARAKAENIGEQIGLSPASVHRRWRRLRQAGVIRAEVAVLDEGQIEKQMTIIVSVEVERERVDLLDEFRAVVHACPEVQQCYYVMGEPDFILIIQVRDMQHYEELGQRLFFGNNNLRRFRSSVVMSVVKKGLNIPL